MSSTSVLLITLCGLISLAAIAQCGPIVKPYVLAPNTPENIALIASGVHRQKVEELSGQFEGDMVLTELQRKAISGEFGARNGLVNTTYRWADKIIPYDFNGDLNENEREVVFGAFRAIEKAAPCLSFVPRTDKHVDFVMVSGQNTGCWSMVGRLGGKQDLNLQKNGCIWQQTIVHEFLHALGFFHMQSSYDRDQYVKIGWEHIIPGLEHNFNMYTPDYITDFGHEYDIRSIMHYSAYSFTKNGFATVIPNVSVGFRCLRFRI